jgi:hypothetical protein
MLPEVSVTITAPELVTAGGCGMAGAQLCCVVEGGFGGLSSQDVQPPKTSAARNATEGHRLNLSSITVTSKIVRGSAIWLSA